MIPADDLNPDNILEDCADHDFGSGAVQRAPDGRLHHRCQRHMHPKWPCVAVSVEFPLSERENTQALIHEAQIAGAHLPSGVHCALHGYGPDVAPHVANDRTWFHANPARKFRLRRQIPSETEWPCADTHWVLVMRAGQAFGRLRQLIVIEPGARAWAKALAADTGAEADRFLAFLLASLREESTNFTTPLARFNAAERLAGRA